MRVKVRDVTLALALALALVRTLTLTLALVLALALALRPRPQLGGFPKHKHTLMRFAEGDPKACLQERAPPGGFTHRHF